MLRPTYKKFPVDYVAVKAAAEEMAALQDLRANHADVFLYQLTELARAGNHALVKQIETNITKEDRSHYLLMHAIAGNRQAIQDEYDLVPADRKLHAKMIVVEGSARGGHIEFAKALVATFPSGFDIEDNDKEKISDIMARIAVLRGYAQSERLELLNAELHQLMLDLDKLDYDGKDRDEFQLYAYEHIITGFYLTGLFEDHTKSLSVMTSLRYISLRAQMGRAYEAYHEMSEEFNLFRLGEYIRGVMFNTKCIFADAKATVEKSLANSAELMGYQLFSYKSNKDDPMRKCYNPKLMPELPQLK